MLQQCGENSLRFRNDEVNPSASVLEIPLMLRKENYGSHSRKKGDLSLHVNDSLDPHRRH